MRSMLFFFLHARPSQLCFIVTLAEIWAAFRNLMATVHVVAMEIEHSKVAEKSLCFIKWLQGKTKCTWASGMKDVRSGFDLFTKPLVKEIFFFNGNKLFRTRFLCFLSQESILFMDTTRAFCTSKCRNIR